jgi:galactokinase
VNLIGEHTDYNDGFVLPMAVDRETLAAWSRRDDRLIRLRSMQKRRPATIDMHLPITRGEPIWANYPRGVAAQLIDRGVELPGCDVVFSSDVPLGGGLSSSASLEVATALALLAAADAADTIPTDELARLCQKAEHELARSPCGIMDQMTVLKGAEGEAMLLDCRSGETRDVPFDDPNVTLLVVDTRVKHSNAGGEYAARRRQCEAATQKLEVDALRDADEEMIEKAARDGVLTEVEQTRSRHVVTENTRTVAAAEALERRDMQALGELMYASHASLRDDYQVSCPELDAVVDIVQRIDGVYGARMTGGGFGGCAIVLAATESARKVGKAVESPLALRFGRRCHVFHVRACAGAGTVE